MIFSGSLSRESEPAICQEGYGGHGLGANQPVLGRIQHVWGPRPRHGNPHWASSAWQWQEFLRTVPRYVFVESDTDLKPSIQAVLFGSMLEGMSLGVEGTLAMRIRIGLQVLASLQVSCGSNPPLWPRHT